MRPEVTGKNVSYDTLVPDPQVWLELGVCSMTGYRWSRDPELGFPKAVKIRNRNYRTRRALEDFKVRMVRRTVQQNKKGA